MSARRVYYLGPAGTFSHILARKRFGTRSDLRPCPTVEAVVEAALAAPGAAGLVPVENSSGGTVYDSVDSLIRNAGRVSVVEELALDVRIALLSRGTAEGIKIVYSHFTQIKHHAAWLKGRFPGARLVTVESTAIAARRAASRADAAALASPGAGPIYGLTTVLRPPAGRTANVTHFFVIRAGAPQETPPARPSKTALVAALPNSCGSLHGFLGPFARLRVNLSRIVSRPVPGQPRTYVFFVEVEGDAGQSPVRRALEQASSRAVSLVSLGGFPVGPKFRS